METVVAMDSNGHFMAVRIENREEVLDLIKKIDDGDYLTDMLNDGDIEIKGDLGEYCCTAWVEFVEQFVQCGTLEIVTINEVKVHSCKCVAE